MSTSIAKELAGRTAARSRTAAAGATPKGWEPRVEHDDQNGEGVTAPRPAGEAPPSHAQVLEDFGLDPEFWEVLTLRKSKWQAQAKDAPEPIWLEAYRATFRAIQPGDPRVVAADIDQLLTAVSTWKPQTPKKAKAGTGPRSAFVVVLSDWQLGKGEGGGTPATTRRILNGYEAAAHRLAALRREGHQIDTVVFPGLGDMVEQCAPEAHYAMQTFQADLDMRQQRQLAWRLLMRGIFVFAPLCERLRVTAIAGNHGESRANGKAYTTFEDNDDLLMLDVAHDIVEQTPALANVTIELPNNPLAHTITAEGATLGLVHGHQFRTGKSAGEKAHAWWLGQMMGLETVRDADILLNGHFHHFTVTEYSAAGRTTMQAPAMDGGSQWFTGSSGQSAAPGMLTMLVGEELGPRKWDHLKIV